MSLSWHNDLYQLTRFVKGHQMIFSVLIWEAIDYFWLKTIWPNVEPAVFDNIFLQCWYSMCWGYDRITLISSFLFHIICYYRLKWRKLAYKTRLVRCLPYSYDNSALDFVSCINDHTRTEKAILPNLLCNILLSKYRCIIIIILIP